MRSLALAALLLATTSAGAQTVSAIEQSYGPYVRPTSESEPALAASNERILMAWSERADTGQRARVRAGLLDFNAQLVSTIVTLPASEDSEDVLTLSAATDGTSFLVAYVAAMPSGMRLYTIAFDANGVPIGAPRRLMTLFSIARPTLIWNGRQYLVWSSGSAFAIERDGTIAAEANTGTPEAIVSANGATTTAAWKVTPVYICLPHWFCYKTEEHWELTWAAEENSGSLPVSTPSGAIALGSNGTNSVAAWPAAGAIQYAIITSGHASGPTGLGVPTETGPVRLACDEKFCLIAAGSQSDVHGVVVDLETRHETAPFSIAASNRSERLPQVHALGDGRFLVAYLSDVPGDQRLAGRIVSMNLSRRRAVR